jgi:hypothetical protein
MTDEHEIKQTNALALGSPAHSLQTTRGEKIASRALLVIPAHTLCGYNTGVEKNI